MVVGINNRCFVVRYLLYCLQNSNHKIGFKTPGRDKTVDETEYTDREVNFHKTGGYDAKGILAALGGQRKTSNL